MVSFDIQTGPSEIIEDGKKCFFNTSVFIGQYERKNRISYTAWWSKKNVLKEYTIYSRTFWCSSDYYVMGKFIRSTVKNEIIVMRKRL